MKKSIFTILLFSSVVFAHAQFEKGEKYLGGNVGLGFTNSSFSQNSSVLTGSGNNLSINLNPTFFKAANSNTLRGFTVGVNFANATGSQGQSANSYKNISNLIGANIGYSIRKYKPFSEKLFWYMEYNSTFSYNYGWQKYTAGTNLTNTDVIGYNVTIGALPALAFKVDNRLLVDVNFGGLSTGYNYTSSEGNHNHNYSVNLNLTSRFTLGILWKLKKSSRS